MQLLISSETVTRKFNPSESCPNDSNHVGKSNLTNKNCLLIIQPETDNQKVEIFDVNHAVKRFERKTLSWILLSNLHRKINGNYNCTTLISTPISSFQRNINYVSDQRACDTLNRVLRGVLNRSEKRIERENFSGQVHHEAFESQTACFS